MKRAPKTFIVIKKGGHSERAVLKAMMLRETVFRASISNEVLPVDEHAARRRGRRARIPFCTGACAGSRGLRFPSGTGSPGAPGS